MLRHQSGSEIKDIFTYFRDQFDNSSPNYAFETTAQSVFVGLLSTFVDKIESKDQLANVLDALVLSTKGVTPSSLFSKDRSGMQLDLLLKRIRRILESVIHTQPELRGKCVEVLMRLGLMLASPEDLIMAAQYQYKFKIDISSQLTFFSTESEIFEEPKSAIDSSTVFKVNHNAQRIQDKCDYNENGSNK